jgi:anti-sigma factor RsiW
MTELSATERHQIEELLPWHAAGTLSRSESKRVDEALARDPELARRFDEIRDELNETIHLNETLGAPSARAMEALFDKIGAEPKRRPSHRIGIAAGLTRMIESLSPRTLAWAAVAGALALILQATFIGSMVINRHGGGYQTASAPSAMRPATTSGTFALVRFAPQASAADITRFLQDNKVSIAAGPQADGFYRVRIAVTGLPKDELARVVKRLQQDKTVDLIATVP